MRTGALIAALLLVGACSGTSEAAVGFETVRDAVLAPGDALPPASDPILVVTDADGTELAELDLETIESVGTVRANVYEQWFARDVDFEGVWLEDLLAVAGVDADAIEIHALDDFLTQIDVAALPDHDAMVATRADGQRIPVEDGGPLRLVFLDPDGVGRESQLWIWNIDAIASR